MSGASPEQITAWIAAASCDDADAAAALLPVVYDELRAIAARHIGGERAGHTLQPTALVHEAFLKLAGSGDLGARDRAHLLAIAARAMRQVLVDHARGRGRAKRGGDRRRLELEAGDVQAAGAGEAIDVLALDEALDELRARSERQARAVELRFFGGLDVAQAALVLGVSERTVKGDWRVARAWLWRRLGGGEGRAEAPA